MKEDIVWTDLTVTEIAETLSELRKETVSAYTAKQLLEQEGYGQRQAQKNQTMGDHPDRDARFRTIAERVQEYRDSPNPIVSIDTKKKELLGNFYSDGRLYTRETLATFDHDFPHFADGVVIPHGLYDLKLNRGYLHLGTSRDTSEFACDCVADWWTRFGWVEYPQATSVLLLCDGGGSNSSRTYVFKAELQSLANRIGLPIRVAHYPPYPSKYNPIEHRLFPHVTRACPGVVFGSLAIVKSLMEKTRTRTGLSVVVDLVDRVYETGRKVSEEVKRAWNLVRDTLLPRWNYQMLPKNE
jgi:hypothetical protein